MKTESGKDFAERWRKTGRLLADRRREDIASTTAAAARARFLLLFQDWQPPARNAPTSGLVQLHLILDRNSTIRFDELLRKSS